MSSIYLAPVGDADTEVLSAVETCLAQKFRFGVKRLKPLPEPEFAFDPAAGQYSSSAIVKELVHRCPADAVRLFALTEKDLFIPMLTFVFGQAQLGGKVAIISLARLRQEFYHLPPSPSLLTARARKETMHEMGHAFGLVHCPDRRCTMSLATNIQQLDGKGSEFCASCELVIREKLSMTQRDFSGPGSREDAQ